MGIKINLPRSLSGITKGRVPLEVNGGSVGECLSHLVSLFPRIEKELFYSGTGESLARDGKLWSRIKVLLNGQNIDEDVLARKVKAGDELYIELHTR